MSPAPFRIGCAVWGHASWVGRLYPEGASSRDFLRLFAHRFTAVEGNTTFYATPQRHVLQRWRRDSPAGFHFLPKLARTITHEGSLEPKLALAADFARRTEELGDRLGALFVQLPSGHGPRLRGDLEAFLDGFVPAAERAGAPAILEVRSPDWFGEAAAARLEELCADRGVGRAVLDTRPIYEGGAEADAQAGSERRKPRLPVARTDARLVMIRFIAHPDLPRNAPWLDEWAERVAAWLAEGRRVYFFAHCPIETFSPEVARSFQRRLEALGADVPPLPWDDAGAASQLSLFGQ